MLSEPSVLPLHHLALGAKDVQCIAEFYSQLFGLPEVRRHFDDSAELRSIWLKLGSAILMIERTTHLRPPPVGVDAGLFLLAFRVDTSERASLEQRSTARGCPLESKTENTSYFRDPEGNRFAISDYPIEV
jgi:glyoxylase I family protein